MASIYFISNSNLHRITRRKKILKILFFHSGFSLECLSTVLICVTYCERDLYIVYYIPEETSIVKKAIVNCCIQL